MPQVERILIVDDELPILETYRDYLAPKKSIERVLSSRQRGDGVIAGKEPAYELLLAQTGEEAVELVRQEVEAGRSIAAGFFDMQMPGGIDGLETIQRIRELDDTILCAVVTAYQDRSVSDINRVFEGGHEDEWDYINKPFTKGEIQQKARNLVSSWNRRREHAQSRRDLEMLVHHIADVKGFARADLLRFLEYVLDHIVKFTGSRGGFVASLDDNLEFHVGNGITSDIQAAREFLSETKLDEMLRDAIAQQKTERVSDLSAAPLMCARGTNFVVLANEKELNDSKKHIVHVFTDSAAAAFDNHKLYHELLEANMNLELHVAARTQALEEVNSKLAERQNELRDMLNTLKETERQLVQSEKLALMGQLAASVAHEINNPCSFILTNLEFLGEVHEKLSPSIGKSLEGDADLRADYDEVPELLAESIVGVRRIVDIVRDLKAFTRAQRDEYHAVDISKVIDQSLQILSNDIRHKAKVVKKYGDIPSVSGNPGRLLQVFLNLVHNALQALDEGEENTITLSTTHEDDRIRVEIQDTGRGIRDEDIDKVFEPFFTTKPTGVGTGLGLSICKNLVEGHGGRMSLDSTVGKGTRVVVELCLWEGEQEAHDTQPVDMDTYEFLQGKKLLIIDDEKSILKALSIKLGKFHQIDTALGGQEGLEKLENNDYDAVVCDLMMPDISGLQVYERIKEHSVGAATRFIFVTGGVFDEQTREFLDEERPSYLLKPYEDEQLDQAIRSVVEKN